MTIRPMKVWVPALAAVVGLAGVTAGCGNSSKAATNSATPTTTAAATTTGADAAACAQVQKANPAVIGKTFTVGNAPTIPGFETVDPSDPSKIVGFDPTFLAAVASCAGFKYSFKTMAFDSLIPALQAHRVDMVISNLIASSSRAQQVNFVLYQQDTEVLIVKKGNPKKITTVNDLCGNSIAVFPGTLQQGLAQQQSATCTAAGKPAVKIDTYSDFNGCVKAVKIGRSDTTIDPQVVAEDAVAKFPADLSVTAPIPQFHNNIGIAFPKNSSVALRQSVLGAVAAVQKAGIEKKILVQWKQSPTVQTTATYLP